MIEKKVIEYIAATQPKLEKMATQQNNFYKNLKTKLNNLEKKGCLSKKECDIIYKEAQKDISSIFKYLDVPSFNRKIGDSSTTKTEIDPFISFAYS